MEISSTEYECVLSALREMTRSAGERGPAEMWTKIEAQRRKLLKTIRLLYENKNDATRVAKTMGIYKKEVLALQDEFHRRGLFATTIPIRCVYSFEEVLDDCLPSAKNLPYYFDNLLQCIETLAIPTDAFLYPGEDVSIRSLKFNEDGKRFVAYVLRNLARFPLSEIVRNGKFAPLPEFYSNYIQQVCLNFFDVRVDYLCQTTPKRQLEETFFLRQQEIASKGENLRQFLWRYVLISTDYDPQCLPGLSKLEKISPLPDEVKSNLALIAGDLIHSVDERICADFTSSKLGAQLRPAVGQSEYWLKYLSLLEKLRADEYSKLRAAYEMLPRAIKNKLNDISDDFLMRVEDDLVDAGLHAEKRANARKWCKQQASQRQALETFIIENFQDVEAVLRSPELDTIPWTQPTEEVCYQVDRILSAGRKVDCNIS